MKTHSSGSRSTPHLVMTFLHAGSQGGIGYSSHSRRRWEGVRMCKLAGPFLLRLQSSPRGSSLVANPNHFTGLLLSNTIIELSVQSQYLTMEIKL